MRKFTLVLSFFAALANLASAQNAVTDSILTGNGSVAYANDVYYSLKDGQVKVIANNNWHIAFSSGLMNVSVRANTATSATGDGAVTVYEMPGTDTTKWTNFDTTGLTTWANPDNSDEDWQLGAFNQTSTSGFDYGWGAYDPSSHIVSGHRLYLLAINSNASVVYKKLWVVSKNFGVWAVRYANLDGSSAKSIQIDANDRNFAYLNVLTDAISSDREPASWDFILTRYKAYQQGADVYYPSTGILTNAGVATSEVRGVDELTSKLSDTTGVGFSAAINVIGADWKVLNAQFQYEMADSLTYFVKAGDGAFWKLVFTEFVSSRGHVAFNKTRLTLATGVETAGNNIKNFTVYPNPASDQINVLFDVTGENTTIVLTDLMGKTMLQHNVSGNGFINHPMDLNGISKGIYLVNIMNGGSRSVQKIVIN